MGDRLTAAEIKFLGRLPIWASSTQSRPSVVGSRPPSTMVWSAMEVPGQLRVSRAVMQAGVPAVSWLLPRRQNAGAPKDIGWVGPSRSGGAGPAVLGEDVAIGNADERNAPRESFVTPIKGTKLSGEEPVSEALAALTPATEGTLARPPPASGAGADPITPLPTPGQPQGLSADASELPANDSQWQVVKLAHGNFDYGAALYASHCVLVMPGVSVAGRVELTPTRLLFFPEALVC